MTYTPDTHLKFLTNYTAYIIHSCLLLAHYRHKYQIITTDIFNPQIIIIMNQNSEFTSSSAIITVIRIVHAALRKLHQIFRPRESCCYTWNIYHLILYSKSKIPWIPTKISQSVMLYVVFFLYLVQIVIFWTKSRQIGVVEIVNPLPEAK